MDAARFDLIARSLSAARSRRGLLGILLALPPLGGLTALFDAEAAKRRSRDKRGKHADRGRQVGAEKKRKKKHKKKKCKAKPQATTCEGKCGSVKNNCKKTVDCGSCACDPECEVCFTCQGGPNPPATCVVDPDQVGETCGACATCDGSGQCIGCDAGLDCCGNACIDLQTDADNCGACGEVCEAEQTCQGGGCGVACGGDFCPSATKICDEGSCQACDVCATCDHTTIQDAIDELVTGTIRICAGTYTRAGNGPVVDLLFLDFTLVGAGADSTILDGGGHGNLSPAFRIRGSTCTMRQLTVTGALGASGIAAASPSELALADVIVRGNVGSFGGGIANEGTLTLNAGTIVRDNGTTDGHGGGIANFGEQAFLTLNDGSRVTGNTAAFFGGGIVNGGGVVTLNAGSEVSGNDAFVGAGGIENLEGTEGPVILNLGSRVCGNDNPQCAGFDDPHDICQDTCP